MVSMEKAAEESKKIREMLQRELKDYIQNDMTLLFNLARGAGIDPTEALFMLNNPSVHISDLMGLHKSMESLKSDGISDSISQIKAKSQKEDGKSTLNKNEDNENSKVDIDYRKEIQDFKRDNPTLIFEIAAEVGIDAQKAMDILEYGSKSELALLYTGMQIVKNAKGIKTVDEMVENAKRM